MDLQRYSGLWYEIARKPFFFQLPNSYNVTAEYTLENGNLRVVNKEQVDIKWDGFKLPFNMPKFSLNSGMLTFETAAYGKAVPVSDNELAVSFDFGLGIWSPPGEYIIVYLGDNYEYSVVSNRAKSNLWILSRTKTLDNVDEIISRLEADGYNLKDLMFTRQV